MKGTTGWIF